MKWQPIETAPKDGTPILAFDGVDGVCVAAYLKSGWDEIADRPARWHLEKTMWGDESTECDPTHWFPIPPLPSV